MPQFNATDAIFFGFRIVKRDPLLVLGLIVLTTVLTIGSLTIIWEDLVAFTTRVQELSATDAPGGDPSEAMSEVFGLYGEFLGSPRFLLCMLLGILLWLLVTGAILRSLVRDRREGWVLGLQLGGDELRIFVVSLVITIMLMILYLGAIVALALVTGLLATLSQGLAFAVFFAALIVVLLGLALVSVRLSAAAPASVGERKFVVFGSWRLTQGRMWGMFGAYVVLAFMYVAASLIVFALSAIIAPEVTALQQGMTSPTDFPDAAELWSPGNIFVSILNAAVNVIFTAAFAGVGAYAYRMLGGRVGYANAHPPEAAAATMG